MLEQAHEQLRKDTVAAVKFLGEVVRDPAAGRETRLKAAGMILDRTLGKAPEHVTLELAQPPWVLALRDMVVVGNDEQARALGSIDADVIDAEVVEDDPTFE